MKISTLLLSALLCLMFQNVSLAQTDKAFNYQAVVRKASGDLIQKTDVSVKFSILSQSEVLLYSEKQDVTTDSYGVLNLSVGKGSKLSGNFETLEWDADLVMKVEVDYDKDGTTDLTGNTPIAKVPSAFYSSKAAVATKAEGLTYELAAVAKSGDYNDLKNKPTIGKDTLVYNPYNYTIGIKGGNSVNLSSLAYDDDNQTLSISGSTLSIAGGNSVTLPTGSGSGDMAKATYDGNNNDKVDVAENAQRIGTFFVSTTIPTNGQVLTYNGAIPQWEPAASGAPADASASAKGIVQLAGDLGGTGGTAAAPKITDGAITTAKIAPLAVDATLLAADAVTTAKILDATIATADIAPLAVDATLLAADAVTTAKILDATIATADIAPLAVDATLLAADAVTTAKILDATIATADIAPLAVDATLLAADAVTTAKILDATIATADIAPLAVDATLLAADAVTTAKILDATIATADIAPLAVDATLLAADAVTTAKIAAGAVTAAKLAQMGATDLQVLSWDNTNSIWKPVDAGATPDATTTATGKVQLAGDLAGTGSTAAAPVITDNAVTTAKILDATIATADIAPLAVDATLLAADAVTTAKILDATIATADIAPLAVDATLLAADAVTTAKILDATIATADIAPLAVDASLLAADAVTTAKIAAGAVTAAKLAQMGATDLQVLSWDNTNSIWKPVDAGATPDATTTATGKVQLAGDLAGTGSTAAAPVITDNAITSAKILDGAVAVADLATDAVETVKVKDGAVTAPKLATDAVETAKIKDANVTLAKVQNIAATTLIGNSTGSAATAQEIALGDGISFDPSGKLSAKYAYVKDIPTSTYNILDTDYILLAPAALGNVTLNFPTSNASTKGRILFIINLTGNNITLSGDAVNAQTGSLPTLSGGQVIDTGSGWLMMNGQ